MHVKVIRTPAGDTFAVRLDQAEWGVLRDLPCKLEDLLLAPERAPRVIDRLFPPAHSDDPEEEKRHRELIGRALLEERLENLKTFRAIVDRAQVRRSARDLVLTLSEVNLWIHVVNDLRLLLGCELDIQDNDWSLHGPSRPEDLQSFLLLLALTSIQQTLIEALEA